MSRAPDPSDPRVEAELAALARGAAAVDAEIAATELAARHQAAAMAALADRSDAEAVTAALLMVVVAVDPDGAAPVATPVSH